MLPELEKLLALPERPFGSKVDSIWVPVFYDERTDIWWQRVTIDGKDYRERMFKGASDQPPVVEP